MSKSSVISSAPSLSDEQIDEQIAALDPKMKARLGRFTTQEISGAGIAGVRPGGTTWEKYQRLVMRKLAKADMRLEDCEESEE